MESVADRPTIAIAGASGFVGKALCAALVADTRLIGITRRTPHFTSVEAPVLWRQADLFSLLQLERALKGADTGVYLVHSMLPTTRLTQGQFADIDLILADNFARGAKFQGVKRIIYLGGLIPGGGDGQSPISSHLRSRLEVEHVLASYGAKVISLRAGLIVGPDGSSFSILERLVQRLPLMICPRWTQTLCQPIALQDVIAIMHRVILDESLPAGSYDIGGPDILSYVAMMNETALALGRKRRFFTTDLFSPTLSRAWVSLITGAPRALVYPLVESLRYAMVTRDQKLQERYGIKGIGFRAALDLAVQPGLVAAAAAAAKPQPSRPWKPRAVTEAIGANPLRLQPKQNTVSSIQRLEVPHGRSVAWTSWQYSHWLPRFLAPLIRVEVEDEGSMRFMIQPLGLKQLSLTALKLHYSRERSDPTRSLFYITGGMLSDSRGRHPGRFEFRQVPGGDEVVVAVLNFHPRLPWWLYRLTQARIHLFVMQCFAAYLKRLVKVSATNPPPAGFGLDLHNSHQT